MGNYTRVTNERGYDVEVEYNPNADALMIVTNDSTGYSSTTVTYQQFISLANDIIEMHVTHHE